MFLIYDTETTGLPENYNAPVTDSDNWPRMVQVAWQLHGPTGELIDVKNYIVKPEGFTIPFSSQKIHGISTERATKEGKDLSWVLDEFNKAIEQSDFIVGHNIDFDLKIVGAEYHRKQISSNLLYKTSVDTKDLSTNFCAIPGGKGGKFKWPKLGELHQKLFNAGFDEAHNASADVVATARCFLELVRLGIINSSILKLNPDFDSNFKNANPDTIDPIELEIESNFEEPVEVVEDISKLSNENIDDLKDEDVQFTHLHLHTQYSILDGAANIGAMVKKAKADNMKAVAITDHGNMFGVKEFHQTCTGEDIKPILGCEVYIVDDLAAEKDRSNFHLILLAKNLTGYHNLLKLISIANVRGMYYRPRIDKISLQKHSEGLIASSACLGGEVSKALMEKSVEEAEKVVLWYKELFKEDYYLEVMRHPAKDPKVKAEVTENQNFVNGEIIKLAHKHKIKVIATNDVHFINEEDATAHDLLICLSTGKDFDDPNRMRYTRHEWFKTQSEMRELWSDYPEAILNTQEIADKVEVFELNSNPIMPEFPIPEKFGTYESYLEKYTQEDLEKEFERFDKLGGFEKVLRIKLESDYLDHLAYEGAKKKYKDQLDEAKLERIKFELNTIKQMGFPGYFLIVQDFINAAKEMGVLVGPGRGSAAGAAVSYSLGITNIDPIKYDLLFERFLNPDRISMPDIDIDFDDDGRQQVLDWVTQKYGQDRVAHICTFGSMAAKMAMKDVARVLQLPLDEANRLTKEFPENGKLAGAYKIIAEKESRLHSLDAVENELKKERSEAEKAKDNKKALKIEVQLFVLNEIRNARQTGNEKLDETLTYACTLEGSVRQTGVHACGIIIGRTSLDDYIPLMPTKEEEILTTQYDGRFVEDIGLLKMDFLGLKTLSIIKETLAYVKLSKGVDIDLDTMPFDDELTYQLFSKGDTTAIFQFESDGMKKYLRGLKPNRFEDLVAMNALYRPGPMDYIPSYIDRKHEREKVEYDHPLMEQYLAETHGITVFQEQVMLLSRLLGNFTRGQSDTLRKAMGKKKLKLMEELKVLFKDGCLNNPEFTKGCEATKKDPNELIEKIWKDWEAFASYAFNKSHSVCYAYVAYQTGYLKAHYPAEFMAANLSRNLSNITEVTKFMEECRRMKMEVKVPDVNESYAAFTVNKDGDIRFGMAAIKGLGEAAVQHIVEERGKNGPYENIYNFIERVNLNTVNKRSIEAMALAGCFDSFGDIDRHQLMFEYPDNTTFIDQLVKYGNLLKNQSSAATLFGDDASYTEAQKKPEIPTCEPWPALIRLNKERDLIGIFLSSHPLDDYKLEMESFTTHSLSQLQNLEPLEGREVIVAGMVTEVQHLLTRTGRNYGVLILEDYSDRYKFMLFSKDYEEYRKYLYDNYMLMIHGIVQENPWRKEEKVLEFKIKKMSMLNNAREDMVKQILIKLPLKYLTEDIVDKIKQQSNKNQGKALLKFQVYDEKEKLGLNLFSRNTSVDVNEDFVTFLDNYPELEYKVS